VGSSPTVGTMITVYADSTDGRVIPLLFNSEDSANQAFDRAGFGEDQEVTDDTGETYIMVNTFYGFSTGEETDTERFQRIASRILTRVIEALQ
jgi:hypothetical protein